MSKVRGSGRECQAATTQERRRGATLCPRSGAATRGVTPCPMSGAAAGRTNPTSRSRGCLGTGGLEELSHVEGQEGRW